jgi:hypothetical protein
LLWVDCNMISYCLIHTAMISRKDSNGYYPIAGKGIGQRPQHKNNLSIVGFQTVYIRHTLACPNTLAFCSE